MNFLENWQKRIQTLPARQKIIIVLVVVALPAGILLGTALFHFWSTHQKKK